MASKKNNYVSVELEFAEKQLQEWRKYMEDNPINEITDRWGKKEMPKGGFAMVVTSTAEQQIKCVQDTMVKYLQLLEQVDKLREKEQAVELAAKGGGNVPYRMKNNKFNGD